MNSRLAPVSLLHDRPQGARRMYNVWARENRPIFNFFIQVLFYFLARNGGGPRGRSITIMDQTGNFFEL